tara:strand:- start:1944 stop:2129 length:186 start_codon:yes stop_codon:yes gene_type:complete
LKQQNKKVNRGSSLPLLTRCLEISEFLKEDDFKNNKSKNSISLRALIFKLNEIKKELKRCQ